jgi:hypothetical protein
VRYAAIICCGYLLASKVSAQQQERSLIDRLLRPDMELQNNAQGKKFPTSSVAVENRGTAGTFYLQPARKEKQVSNLPNIGTNMYKSRSLGNDSQKSSSLQNREANLPGQLTASSVQDINENHDSHLKVADRSFVGDREFREQGKSQKSLDRQNPPLTIDQVRELLNKNK